MRDALLLPLLAALTVSLGLTEGAAAATATDAENPAAAVAAPADVGSALTLTQAIELALRDRPELAAARSDVHAAEAALSQASAHPNPVFEAQLEDTRPQTRTTTYMLSQTFELGGKRAARQDAARQALDVALSLQLARRQQLRVDVTAAFFEALSAQEWVRLAESAVALAQRASEAARKRVLAGKVSPIDETKARVVEAGVRVEAVQARSARRIALQTLRAATGSGRHFERLDGEVRLPDTPSQDVVQQRVTRAATVLQAQWEVERLGALARLERAKRVPDVTVGVGTQRSEELGRSQAMLTLTIPLPIFDTNRGAEVEALRRQDTARYAADAALLRLRADVAAAHARLQAAVAEVQLLEQDVLPGAVSAHETSTRGFELGKFGFLDVLDSQRTLLQARSQHLKTIAEARQAAAEIDRLLISGDHVGGLAELPAVGARQP